MDVDATSVMDDVGLFLCLIGFSVSRTNFARTSSSPFAVCPHPQLTSASISQRYYHSQWLVVSMSRTASKSTLSGTFSPSGRVAVLSGYTRLVGYAD